MYITAQELTRIHKVIDLLNNISSPKDDTLWFEIDVYPLPGGQPPIGKIMLDDDAEKYVFYTNLGD